MTKEEIIEFCEMKAELEPENEDIYEAVIKELEQQPREDIEVIKVSKGAVKARQGRFVIYDVEWLKKNFYVTEEKIYGQPKQPSEDCISREAALEQAMDYGSKTFLIPANSIKALPSVTPKYTDEEIDKAQLVEQAYVDKMVELAVEELKTPKTEWVPVSERLPEDYIHVLCQFYLGGMGECYLAHGAFHVVGGVVMTCNEVIAWLPLPQPYVESEE